MLSYEIVEAKRHVDLENKPITQLHYRILNTTENAETGEKNVEILHEALEGFPPEMPAEEIKSLLAAKIAALELDLEHQERLRLIEEGKKEHQKILDQLNPPKESEKPQE